MKIHYTKLFKIAFLALIVVGISSCSKDEDEDLLNKEVQRGNIFPNKIEFVITSISDSTKTATYTHYDPDGTGGANPIIQDTAIFPLPIGVSLASFRVKLKLFKDGTELSSQVLSQASRYAICFRDYNFFELAQTKFDTDQNGNNLGLNSEWEAKIRNRRGVIKITMNYNQQAKDGFCDSGSRVYEAYLPFSIE